MSFLQLDDLSKTYPNGVRGLAPTHLTVEKGECLGILGPSGSGKSTLLRLLAGLETPSTGKISLEGVEIQHLEPHLREVAWMSQRPALYPHLKVRENLAIGLRLHQKHHPRRQRISESEIQRKVLEASDILQIERLLEREISELSGGEQRRVALGRAIVRGAKWWLLDEPFSQLDAHLRYEICSELLLLRRQLQATILFVTHEPIEALALANRIGVLGGGRLLQLEEAAKIVQNPGHRTVAVCLGWPPMNFIDGKSEPLSGSVFCFRTALGRLDVQPGIIPEYATTLGIFPQDLRVQDEKNDPEVGVFLGRWKRIRSFFHQGSGWLILQKENLRWVARATSPEPNTPGSEQDLFVRQDRLYWFDREGTRIPSSS